MPLFVLISSETLPVRRFREPDAGTNRATRPESYIRGSPAAIPRNAGFTSGRPSGTRPELQTPNPGWRHWRNRSHLW
jgi:hypothetical protein